MSIARSFRDLKTYEKARAGAKEIYEVSKRFPPEERYSLTSQIRRSSRATTALLAEAWARRRYKAAFVNKIDEALGEAMETQAWLDHALDMNYITSEVHDRLDELWQEVGAMLMAMINRADDFCKNAPDHQYLREEPETYDL
ncbi:MAG: four helix bundle protein [Verrucomicrobia bacterium]|nr:four helix bundle protein [Verrucomicrobiota bacterium]MBU1909083.1 four helix bundle protein [Verrucomicrobiota bacterium]